MDAQKVKLAAGQCPTVATDIFTAFSKINLLSIDISNPTGSAQDVTLKINGVPLFAVEMPTKGGVSWRGPQVIYMGDLINLIAGSASCGYLITGEVIT